MSIPIILHAPHASRHIPARVREHILLSDEALEYELDKMTDGYTDLMATRIQQAITLPEVHVIASPVSRLVVDVERFPDERETMNSVGMGAIYTKTHDQKPLRSTNEGWLIDEYFTPYADRFTRLVDDCLATAEQVLIIDLHSYSSVRLPYEIVGEEAERPEICLGTAPYHTPQWLEALAKEELGDWQLFHNSPFEGTYVPLKHYEGDNRVLSLMLEMRRDQYMDEVTMSMHNGFARLCYQISSLVQKAGSSILTSP